MSVAEPCCYELVKTRAVLVFCGLSKTSKVLARVYILQTAKPKHTNIVYTLF